VLRRSLALAIGGGLAASILLFTAVPASAHAQRQAGPIHMEIGFGTEPAYAGQPNSVQLILTDNGKPVVDLGDSLKVEVAFGGQQTEVPLEANFEVGGDGTPGDYRAWFIPSQPGPYTFHITGSVHSTQIDEKLKSGPTTFDTVQDPVEAAFPALNVPTNQQLATRIEQDASRLDDTSAAAAAAMTTATETHDAAGTTKTLAILSTVVGIAALIVGIVALLLARRTARVEQEAGPAQ
jgi:hypothetical protein